MLYALAMIVLTALPALAQDAPPDTTGWFEDPSRLTQTDGKMIYGALCAACHMPEGQGIARSMSLPTAERRCRPWAIFWMTRRSPPW